MTGIVNLQKESFRASAGVAFTVGPTEQLALTRVLFG
jgi:hypothetical protein